MRAVVGPSRGDKIESRGHGRPIDFLLVVISTSVLVVHESCTATQKHVGSIPEVFLIRSVKHLGRRPPVPPSHRVPMPHGMYKTIVPPLGSEGVERTASQLLD